MKCQEIITDVLLTWPTVQSGTESKAIIKNETFENTVLQISTNKEQLLTNNQPN